MTWPESTPYIIAEAGINHNGDLITALELVDEAKRCGADAVKFQLFVDRLPEYRLSACEWMAIRERCDEKEIDFISTAFCIESLKRVVSLNPVAIKLSSQSVTNIGLIDAAAKTGLPVILSTGMSTGDEVVAAVERLGMDAIYLHCQSAYPAKPDELNMGLMLMKTGPMRVGYSDHTAGGSMAAVMAVAMGAEVIEKHIMRSFEDCPDKAVSMDEEDFSEYVIAIRSAAMMMGDGHKRVMPCEEEARRKFRGDG